MRHILGLLIATTALASCSDPGLEGKAVKNTALTSKQEVKLRLAHATEEGGDFAGSEQMFLQVARQSPDSAAAQAELAGFYRRHHADEKAIGYLTMAVKLEPENTDIKRELANTYINTGEPEKAIALLDQAITINRKDPLLYNSKGVALDQTGSYAKAQRCYKTAYDIDPIGGTTYKINISMSYILEGSYDKAIALLRPMLTAPEAPPIIRQNLALAYGMKGENDEALKLGLEDLSNSEAEENVRFYRMLAHKHGGKALATRGAASTPAQAVPAQVVRDLFPENEPSGNDAEIAHDEVISHPEQPHPAQAAPVHLVSISENPVPDAQPKPVLKILSVPDSSYKDKEETSSVADTSPLPTPVLKPDQY